MKPRCGVPMRDGVTGEPTSCGKPAGHKSYKNGAAGHKSTAAMERNRERSATGTLALYRRRCAVLIARLGGRCVICGSTEHLEFDHIDWRTVSERITNMVTRGASAEAIEAELAKCQLLCKPCHVDKTKTDVAEWRAERRTAKAA